jgi:hypothetical protein
VWRERENHNLFHFNTVEEMVRREKERVLDDEECVCLFEAHVLYLEILGLCARIPDEILPSPGNHHDLHILYEYGVLKHARNAPPSIVDPHHLYDDPPAATAWVSTASTATCCICRDLARGTAASMSASTAMRQRV